MTWNYKAKELGEGENEKRILRLLQELNCFIFEDRKMKFERQIQ
jgi:hypothetical protein